MRVLLAAAQTPAARQVAPALVAASAEMEQAAAFEDVLALARLYPHDLILLGERLEDASAIDALRKLRAAGVATPVIWLCGDVADRDRIRALDLGADDCAGPGVETAELLARARAVVRRAAGHAASILRVGRLSVNMASRGVTYAGKPVPVTRKEFAILELLALRVGAVVRREAIMDHLYGGRDAPVLKVIDIYVSRIRRKLAVVAPGQPLVRTIWGEGFVLGSIEPGSGLAMAA